MTPAATLGNGHAPESATAIQPRPRTHGTAYPKRPKVFACKYIRLLTKKCVANELGPQVFTLLAVVAATEDARGYTDAVNWYNHQLMPLIGAGSTDTLDRVRRKAVDAGWLNYTPGTKGKPGYYFVTVPERYQGTDDAPTDEDPGAGNIRTGAEESAGNIRTGAEESAGNIRTGAERSRRQAGGMCGTPIPVPVPVLKTPAGAGGESGSAPGEKPGRVSGRPTRKKPGEEDPLFCAFYRAYPLHEDRPAAWKAWRKLKPDADLAGAIMAGVKRYKATKPDWQNWKQPGPWLNARRWEDEAPTTPESPASKFRPPSDFDTQPPRRSNSPCPTR